MDQGIPWEQNSNCGKRNTVKLEKVNERALRYVYKDKQSSYENLLSRIGTASLEIRRIQDMIITIDKCLNNRGPQAIKELISIRQSSYNLRGDNILDLPKVSSTKHGLTPGATMQQKHGTRCLTKS